MKTTMRYVAILSLLLFITSCGNLEFLVWPGERVVNTINGLTGIVIGSQSIGFFGSDIRYMVKPDSAIIFPGKYQREIIWEIKQASFRDSTWIVIRPIIQEQP